ncbi:uncharacterized protein [Diabrotica undecimpunctata]|uniref:uncharacterized protein n=1 Tax=Diabrotica undecimpunctata TaxID=50387 RepID=UPI003B6378CA
MTRYVFVAAFKRFTSRKGRCSDIYSDNGTSFAGAANLLFQDNERVKASLKDTLTTLGTHWHFIPAYGPHFGGLWESAVKIINYHLKRVIGDSALTYNELSTVLAQIETSMNFRHLCVNTEDTSNRRIITPGDFLIGRELISQNRKEELRTYTNMPQRWRQLEKVKREF